MNTQQQNLPRGNFRRPRPQQITDDTPFNWRGTSGALRTFGGMMFYRGRYPHFLDLSLHAKVELARENLLRTFLQVPVEDYRA